MLGMKSRAWLQGGSATRVAAAALALSVVSASTSQVLAGGSAYSVMWYTVDAGGGTSTSVVYSLSGTIGQPDAHPPASSGRYALAGGFWTPMVMDLPCSPADLAEPFGLLDLADIIDFISAFYAQDLAADLAEPFGLLDLSDVVAFVTSFNAGCP